MKQFYLTTLFCCFVFSLFGQTGSRCSNALLISPATYTVDTMYLGGSLYSTTNPFPNRGRWYKFTPATDGLATLSSCNGGADTRVFVYTGRCDSLVIFGDNDDFCGFHPDSLGDYAASFSKPVRAGTTYYVLWDNAWSDDDFTFTYSLTAFTPAAMQHCSTARPITTGIVRVANLVGYASHGNANRANWYRLLTPLKGIVTISSCGTAPDTRIWVYDNVCSSLRSLADADDNCLSSFGDMLSSTVSFNVSANKTFYIEWDDFGENAAFDFSVSLETISATNDPTLMKQVSVAPNPAQDFITLQFDFDKTADVSLNMVNMVGQTVLSQKWPSILRGPQNLDISTLDVGVYFIQIREGSRRAYQKLVISR
jgi:Secretion system C-terminal sorting domain